MVLAKTTYIKEVVIRYDNAGNFESADVTRIEVIDDNGDVQAIKSLPPEILTQAEVDGIVSAANAGVPQQISDLTAERDQAVADKATAEQALTDEQAAHAATVTAKDAEIAATVASKDAEIASRDTQIADLQAQLNPVDAQGFAVLNPVQLRLGLLGGGITTAMVESYIATISDPTERETASTFWDYSTEFHRDHALITQFAAGLGLTSEEVDTMWTAAAQIS